MTAPLRLGIVGCGWIAGYVALLARLNRRIHLVACCDRVLSQAERFAARHRIPRAYDDYPAMLQQETLDAVYLAVPHDLHLEMAQAAAESGRHVLLEKPLARTLAEGQEIVRLGRTSGLCIGVNYQYRYDPGCYALAMAARQGDLGELYYGRCNLPWQRDAAYFERGAWRGQLARAGGGTLLTQGSHALDVLLWALGGRPIAAQGATTRCRFSQVEVEDLALGPRPLSRRATQASPPAGLGNTPLAAQPGGLSPLGGGRSPLSDPGGPGPARPGCHRRPLPLRAIGAERAGRSLTLRLGRNRGQ